ncbi:hypothetical protein F4680DRAFT_432206 [Xylaria scruposa]|nr:hypothetical protein F4680DRAFT_432206 [Xylaria scruposa]
MTKGKPRGNEAAGVTTDDGNIVLKKSERKPVVGFCPRGTQKGDFVCILFGCSVPLVLRQIGSGDGGQYTLIGECYVHGKMDGEAMVDSENEINFKLE